MIRVALSNIAYNDRITLEDDSQEEVTIQVEGHAGAGVKGSDPLCAAVSVLAGTLMVSITRIADLPQKIEQREGFLRSDITLKGADPENKDRFLTIMEYFLIGILEVRRTDPNAVTVTFNSKEI